MIHLKYEGKQASETVHLQWDKALAHKLGLWTLYHIYLETLTFCLNVTMHAILGKTKSILTASGRFAKSSM